MDSNLLNSFGLIFDIIGVSMLFKYGLPSDVSKDGKSAYTSQNINQDEVNKYRRYKRMSSVALTCILFGFIIQIVSNHYDSIFGTMCQQ